MASPLVRQFDEHSRSIHATLMFVCVWLCLCGCVCVAVCATPGGGLGEDLRDVAGARAGGIPFHPQAQGELVRRDGTCRGCA